MRINIEKTIETALKAYGYHYEKNKWYPDLINSAGDYERVDFILYNDKKVPIAALYYHAPSSAAAFWCIEHAVKLIVFREQEYEMMKDPAYINGVISAQLTPKEGSAAGWQEDEEEEDFIP